VTQTGVTQKVLGTEGPAQKVRHGKKGRNMRAVVVYESMFGNTELVARAVAEGLAPAHGEVEVVNVDDAGQPGEVDLLIVGGPTHAYGMSRPGTREEAKRQAKDGVRSTTGLREWLETLTTARSGAAAAVFDTRMGKPRWLTGSAAKGVAKRLRQHGYELVAPPESFIVDGTTPGKLREGELARAREWARGLAVRASH
jgi:hypothetical protein